MTSLLPSSSFHSPSRRVWAHWKTKGALSDSEHPILLCSDSNESNGKNKRWMWGHENSWEYFRRCRIQGWGQSWKDMAPLPASVLDHQEQNERVHCISLGLQFSYFSWFSPSFSKPCLVNTPLKCSPWQRMPLWHFPQKLNHTCGFFGA